MSYEKEMKKLNEETQMVNENLAIMTDSNATFWERTDATNRLADTFRKDGIEVNITTRENVNEKLLKMFGADNIKKFNIGIKQ